jgi:hypothetical protein
MLVVTVKNRRIAQWFVKRHGLSDMSACGKQRSIAIFWIKPFTPTYDVSTCASVGHGSKRQQQ